MTKSSLVGSVTRYFQSPQVHQTRRSRPVTAHPTATRRRGDAATGLLPSGPAAHPPKSVYYQHATVRSGSHSTGHVGLQTESWPTDQLTRRARTQSVLYRRRWCKAPRLAASCGQMSVPPPLFSVQMERRIVVRAWATAGGLSEAGSRVTNNRAEKERRQRRSGLCKAITALMIHGR